MFVLAFCIIYSTMPIPPGRSIVIKSIEPLKIKTKKDIGDILLAKHKSEFRTKNGRTKDIDFIDTLGKWQVGDTIRIEDIK